jgi:hypothetical protein
LSWPQIILTCVISLLAGYAGAAFKSVSGSSRTRKALRDIQTTVADLESSFDSLLESHKRLRSRAGMRELREKPAGPESKADARARIFGNKSGPAFARQQLEQQ